MEGQDSEKVKSVLITAVPMDISKATIATMRTRTKLEQFILLGMKYLCLLISIVYLSSPAAKLAKSDIIHQMTHKYVDNRNHLSTSAPE